ncbi:MAG TPA: cysteine synthase family protein [Candidatus Baltobacteraceae bacterium]|nr:cysteine synthase family protein [Candidatus Baltobacteraceae bacterium]
MLGLIGNTPLVSLQPLIPCDCRIFGKVEFLNPGGSVKDRIAVALVLDAEERNVLKPGGTIVEPTSGNTGASLAMVAAVRGYRCILVTPEKTSAEKVAAMRAYGAQVIVAPNVPVDDSRHYTRVASRIAAETGAYMPDQYANPVNALTCEKTIGAEIWQQTGGKVTHVVAGLGTGGTACGVARALKSRKESATIVGVEPVGSVYSGAAAKAFEVEGIGRHYVPASLDMSLIDRVEIVSDLEAFEMARRAAREAGLLVGGSSGAALVGAARVCAQARQDAYIVVILPDSGRAYLSKIFNDEYLAKIASGGG